MEPCGGLSADATRPPHPEGPSTVLSTWNNSVRITMATLVFRGISFMSDSYVVRQQW
jgi:hypothetical protein